MLPGFQRRASGTSEGCATPSDLAVLVGGGPAQTGRSPQMSAILLAAPGGRSWRRDASTAVSTDAVVGRAYAIEDAGDRRESCCEWVASQARSRCTAASSLGMQACRRSHQHASRQLALHSP